MESIQKQHIAKIDTIRKDHIETLENIRMEMLKRESERIRQWIESEKETLHVLNAVSQLWGLNEDVSKLESEKIIGRIDQLENNLTKNSLPFREQQM